MKIGFVSLGCPKNLVDSEVMIGLVQQAGHEITADPSSADVLVVNTCAFIDSAKQESVDTILELAELKKTGRCRKLVVTGCLAERYRGELQAQIGEIDAVLGTGEVPDIVRAVTSQEGARPGAGVPVRLFRTAPTVSGKAGDAAALPEYLYDADTPRTLVTPKHYAYVKVAEGCDYACAFCIIPTLRGHYRSRTPQSILTEARQLADRGVRELLLISQDTTFFGVDRGERGALARLLRDLNRVDGLEWIRLLYLYPTTITDDLLDAMAESEKVCNYVDLPLQHAAPGVLKRMRRPGTGTTYRRLLDRIRTRVPGVALRTTLIVGFPGETADQFETLASFVRDVRFDHLGVFTYSHEEGTSAYALADDVPARVKRQRRSTLMSVQKRLVRKAQRRRVGDRVRVMVDGPSPEHGLVLRGRLASQAPEIDSCVYLTDADPGAVLPGHLLDGTIVGSREYDLVVRPLPAADCG
ncbi:MAG TPA: 30S ribosomal protein S12 methylthiotransferase RimO [Vicinamibacterales bacterium]|nr:30S ribosomal protein S12 methylthiotransferase RimO [Vicinamibacterales bacterium]